MWVRLDEDHYLNSKGEQINDVAQNPSMTSVFSKRLISADHNFNKRN